MKRYPRNLRLAPPEAAALLCAVSEPARDAYGEVHGLPALPWFDQAYRLRRAAEAFECE